MAGSQLERFDPQKSKFWGGGGWTRLPWFSLPDLGFQPFWAEAARGRWQELGAGKEQQMALYSPKVGAGAIPPNNYPPTWSLRKGVACCAFAVVHACVDVGLRALLGDSRQVLLLSFTLAGLFGYVYVSGVVLCRPNPTYSRYSSSNELFKLLVGMVVLYFAGPHTVLPHCVTSNFVAPFYLGLHFTYLDCNPVLQSIGCKFPVPNRWGAFTQQELLVLGLATAFALPAFKYQWATLVAHDLATLADLTYVYTGTMLLIGVYGWYVRHTHNIHFHHYMMGLCLVPFFRGATTASCVGMAVFAGVFVEGVAVWGMDPLYVRTCTQEGSASNGDESRGGSSKKS